MDESVHIIYSYLSKESPSLEVMRQNHIALNISTLIMTLKMLQQNKYLKNESMSEIYQSFCNVLSAFKIEVYEIEMSFLVTCAYTKFEIIMTNNFDYLMKSQ